MTALAEEIAQSTSTTQFSSYARQYSATATRGAGGQLPWQNLSDLPPVLQPLILALAPGEVQAANLRAQVDVCDDLYAFAKGQPEGVLERETRTPSELPQDFAIELSKLDDGEVSTALTRSDGQALVFLMMCGRTAEQNADVSREDVANALRQRRLSSFADSLLEELRADARITVE